MSALFSPITLRHLVLPNRIIVSPMCQYSAEQGLATDWHMIHLGTPAMSGAESAVPQKEGGVPPREQKDLFGEIFNGGR